MSEQSLTYEGILEMFRETRLMIQETTIQMRETDRRMQETDRLAKEAHKKISELGSRIGEIIECMVEGGIVDKFQALDYEIVQCGRNVRFWHPKTTSIRGEIDLFLEDGDVAILVEVKTTLETTDVRSHMERLEKFRLCADARGDKRRFIGAVAGAVVKDEVKTFAHENGLYTIIQSGEAFEIESMPEGFKVKEW